MTMQSPTDLAGWSAAGLTLLTFVCSDMRHLRLLAICANVAFITYGAMAGLVPVLVLHLTLAPINVWRLVQQFGGVRSVCRSFITLCDRLFQPRCAAPLATADSAGGRAAPL